MLDAKTVFKMSSASFEACSVRDDEVNDEWTAAAMTNCLIQLGQFHF